MARDGEKNKCAGKEVCKVWNAGELRTCADRRQRVWGTGQKEGTVEKGAIGLYRVMCT